MPRRGSLISGATAAYASIQSTYWMSFAVVSGFSSVYLLAGGLSNAQIGLFSAICGMATAFLQPRLGAFADRSQIPLRSFIVSGAGLLALISALLLLPAGNPWVAVITYALLIIGSQTLSPLIDALGMAAISWGCNVNYGVARGLGSVSYGLISTVAGYLVAARGEGILPWLFIILFAALLAASLSFRLRAETGSEADGTDAGRSDRAPGDSVRYNPVKLKLFLLGMVLILTSHAVLNRFMFQILTALGGDSSTLGLAMNIGAVVEIVPMFAYNRLNSRFGADKLIRLAAVGFVLKSLTAALAVNAAGIYLAQFLQVISFGLYAPASAYYINALLPAAQRINGQARLGMAMTLAGVIGSLLGGWLLDLVGVTILQYVATAIAAAGLLLVLPSVERIPDSGQAPGA